MMPTFTRRPYTLTGFPACAKEITPSDSSVLTDHDGNVRSQTVYVGGAGTVVVVPVGNDLAQTVAFVCPAGGLVPVEVRAVKFSGTTATNLVGVY
jgi:hypothetical protein